MPFVGESPRQGRSRFDHVQRTVAALHVGGMDRHDDRRPLNIDRGVALAVMAWRLPFLGSPVGVRPFRQ